MIKLLPWGLVTRAVVVTWRGGRQLSGVELLDTGDVLLGVAHLSKEGGERIYDRRGIYRYLHIRRYRKTRYMTPIGRLSTAHPFFKKPMLSCFYIAAYYAGRMAEKKTPMLWKISLESRPPKMVNAAAQLPNRWRGVPQFMTTIEPCFFIIIIIIICETEIVFRLLFQTLSHQLPPVSQASEQKTAIVVPSCVCAALRNGKRRNHTHGREFACYDD